MIIISLNLMIVININKNILQNKLKNKMIISILNLMNLININLEINNQLKFNLRIYMKIEEIVNQD